MIIEALYAKDKIKFHSMYCNPNRVKRVVVYRPEAYLPNCSDYVLYLNTKVQTVISLQHSLILHYNKKLSVRDIILVKIPKRIS